MSLIKDITGKVQDIRGRVETYQKDRQKAKVVADRATAKRETQMINTRNKYLPGIQSIAAKYGASVEVLDTAAYVYKTDGNRANGVHINYGEGAATITRKLETKFTKSATTSKVIKGFTSAMHKAKDIREQLGEAGAAMKGAMGEGGGMYDNPNFGGAFAERPASGGSRSSGGSSGGKRKKSRPQRNPDQIYPDIKW